MFPHQSHDHLPRIVVSESEERRLTSLATASALLRRGYEVARGLLSELERAEVVSDDRMPDHVVRMNSVVEFTVDGRASPRVELVFPRNANIGEGKVSILTPIGTALLGLSPGQSIPVLGNDGREHRLTVLAVYGPPQDANPASV
jgi:regulator of nucleoside diphosphate kinase